MTRRLLMLLLAASMGACMVGPSYHAPAPVPEGAAIARPPVPDSTRAFFDSLAVARSRDSLATADMPVTQRLVVQDSMAGVAWLDILRDTTLVKLVNIALRQNRNLQTAVARIQEYRADAGAARAPLFPTLSANGSVSSAQVALGIFPPASYRATRVTGDVAWELDFWGRIRHGLDAANADVAVQVAAERGTVLSLVSDVATSYLQLLELDQEHAIAEQTLASRRATLELAQQRYSQGLISELDVKQFEAQVAAPAVTLAQTERERAQTAHALNVLLGEATAPIPRGGSLAAAVKALVVPDSVPATLLSRRPDVQQAERQYAAATARLGMADAARMPTIMVTGSYGSQAARPGDLFQTEHEDLPASGRRLDSHLRRRATGRSVGRGARARRTGATPVPAGGAERPARCERRAGGGALGAGRGGGPGDAGRGAARRARPGATALHVGAVQLSRSPRRAAESVRGATGAESGATAATHGRRAAVQGARRRVADGGRRSGVAAARRRPS